MTGRALLRLAWRESRTARRRLALYMSSIAFGVAALVAIDSFAGNATNSIREQSRTLLGGDMSLGTRAAPPAVVDTLLDSLAAAGIPNSRVTTFASMALAEPSGGTRLVQVRSVTPGYPFYGAIETVPANGWSRVHDEPWVFVDPSLLIALDASIGDSLRLGQRKFLIAGTLGNVPGDAGITAVIGPRVYVSDRWVESTALLRLGSRAEYETVLRLPVEVASGRPAARFARDLRRRIDPRAAALAEAAERRQNGGRGGRGGGEGAPGEDDAPSVIAAVRDTSIADTLPTSSLRTDSARGDTTARDSSSLASGLTSTPPPTRVRIRTIADTEEDFTESVTRLADFLSIIGLIALLLGGIGVASGVNAFVSAKIDTVAVLRCLGATSRQILALYVVQAAAMGFVGATAGAALGVAVQFLLPNVIGDFLPVDVRVAIETGPVLVGIGTGIWVSLIFAMRPLLALRRVSPLQAIRRDADNAALPREWKDPARLTVDVLLVSSLIGIILCRIGDVRNGLFIAGGIAGAVLVLWIAATALIAIARRSARPSWPFELRQGVANLHRPANQTRAVTLALGFGAFLLSTVYLVQANLLGRVTATAETAAGNLLFFDVQDNQAAPLDSMLRAQRVDVVQQTPIVTMRVDAINGRSVTSIMADTARRRGGWALRREFRSTYREKIVASEQLVAGAWFADSATRAAQRRADPNAPFPASFEQDVATELGVGIGDTVTWNVQGVPVRTIVANLRTVNWARFEANFFVVFAPEALRRAPQQFVVVANVASSETLATIQRDAVRQFPNVSSLDLTLVRKTIDSIV
ncbi:MAG TPA: ABC transporter permease [Gemmatimonas sp.]|nr:ABC transporter permease [Gemmatimonas sp.]